MKKIYKTLVISTISVSAIIATLVGLSTAGILKLSNPNLKYSCKFYNYDNTFLYSCAVAPSHDAIYKGPSPERQETLYSTYQFKGWDEVTENITEDRVFHAVFKEKKKDYLVNFVNYNGDLLYETYVEAGDTAFYAGDTPTKEIGDSFNYVFDGWDKPFDPIFENTVYTATYARTDRLVNIRFENYDGTLLYESTAPYNGKANYYGPEPKRESTNSIKYVFSGWDKPITGLVEDTTFVAQYNEELSRYTVTFVNYDGSFLSSCVVEYQESATYNGPIPRRDNEGKYTFTFIGWDKTFDCVTEDLTVVAQYEPTIPEYTITFKNYDGTVLGSDTVEIGEDAVYSGEIPTRPDTEEFSYKFVGWDRDLTNVQKDFFTIAVYEEIPKVYTVTFCNYNKSVLQQVEVSYGETAVYTGATPYKPQDDLYYYVFKGWSVSLTQIHEDTTAYALFDAFLIEVTSGDEEGTGQGTGSGGSGTGEGEGGSGEGEGSQKSEEYVYGFFRDWNQRTSTKWPYIDRNTLDEVEDRIDIYIVGNEAKYFERKYGEVVRESAEYNYVFDRFDVVPETKVTKENYLFNNREYYYAQYYIQEKSGAKKYIATFRNDDYSLLKEVICSPNETPVYPGVGGPSPAKKENSDKIFEGWDVELSPMTRSMTFYAKYKDPNAISNGSIHVKENPKDKNYKNLFTFNTIYQGDIYFRERSYSDFDPSEKAEKWNAARPYNNEIGANEINPLLFTSDKLKRASMNQYSLTLSHADTIDKSFAIHPIYLTNNNTMKSNSDAYLLGGEYDPLRYSFMPNEITPTTLAMLQNSINFSSDAIAQEEEMYNSFARSYYLSVPIALQGFFSSFVKSMHLDISNINDIYSVKEALNNYKDYAYYFGDYSQSSNIILDFLTGDGKKGDSTHFATVLTLLYRALGTPARYVTGAKAKSFGDETTVTEENLCAWTEVYVSKVGWIAIDASVGANQSHEEDGGNIYNPFGELKNRQATIRVFPKGHENTKYYDGFHVIAECQLDGNLDAGDNLEIELIQGSKNVGTYVTRAIPKIYNSLHVDVTKKYIGKIEMIYEEYTIKEAEILIRTESKSKERDGKALVCEEFSVVEIKGHVAFGDKITFEFTGTQTKPGSSPNTVKMSTLQITNAAGEDVLRNYIVTWDYGKLTVT